MKLPSVSKIFSSAAVLLLAATIAAPVISPAKALAAVTNPAPASKISFTFDDGLTTASTQAAPTLTKYGLTGTDYVITGCVGMTKVNNTCRANTDTTYMTWAQIQALQNTSGWEIGSHTVDHDCLASNATADPDDCQAATLTQAQVDTEMTASQASLAANGIKATDFAPPYGDYSNMVMAQIAKSYASMRQFKNAANNPDVWPYSDYYLQDYTVQEKTDTVASIETKINTAITNNQWLILTFHDIETKPSKTPDDYQYGTAELDQIAAYVKTKQTAGLIQNTTINKGLVTSDTNMLANGSFNDGVADGWTTDSPTTITKDTGNNGSYPDPTNSIKLTGSTANTHLFSPLETVDPNTTYMFKNFLNTSADNGGQVGFYIDEYNAQGQWISGQYKATEPSNFVEDMNFTYKPTNALVAKASMQVIVTAGENAYLDNSQMFALNSVTPPVLTNLMTNSTFDSGLTGWNTDDPANVTADAGSHGSPANPINSVKMVANASKNNHLFSPLISVDSTKQYQITPYLNLASLSGGGVAFYIDEYNAAGQWISGQYKFEVSTVSAQDQPFGYQPTSASVKSASLQVIVVGGSNITAYIDNVRWYQL